MCTMTFLPGLPGGGYVLATNRDESPHRAPATEPFLRERGDRLLLAPRDTDQGGTWVGVDDLGRSVCVLNGDRPPAAEPPADAISRGLLVLDLLDEAAPDAVRAELERRVRDGALVSRPFKLIVAAPGDAERHARLARADWDGAALRWDELDGPQCIVSSTFDTDVVNERRLSAFRDFLTEAPRADAGALVSAVQDFQSSHEDDAETGDAYSVCMHRDDARTVSSTLVAVTDEEVSMHYQPGWPCQDGPVSITTMPRTAATEATS
jgi:hypothetical protein